MKSLSEQQVAEIKKLYRAGVSQVKLSKDYGVSRATIQNYIRGYGYDYRKKRLADLTLQEWTRIAKENHTKISNRPNAIIKERDIWLNDLQ